MIRSRGICWRFIYSVKNNIVSSSDTTGSGLDGAADLHTVSHEVVIVSVSTDDVSSGGWTVEIVRRGN